MVRNAALVLLFGLVGSLPTTAAAQGTTAPDPTFSIHVGAGIGAGLGQTEITDVLLGGEFGVGLSAEVMLVGGVGLRDILEVELRVVDAAYLFRDNDIVNDVTTEIAMDFDSKEVLGKIGPLGGSRILLMGGAGTVEWFDDAGDGFTGNSLLFGIEKEMSRGGFPKARFGFLYRAITYDAASFQGIDIPADLSGNTMSIYLTVLVGLQG